MSVCRQRVAILGAGPGAISAAYWLTSSPALCERFEVTVYAEGWRLGGKCASGRAPDTGAIREHGLHVLMGSYEHAFATIRRCFEQWQPTTRRPWAQWCDAFVSEESVMLQQRVPSSLGGVGWSPWPVRLPSCDGQPGDTLMQWSPDQVDAQEASNGDDGDVLWRQCLPHMRTFLTEQSKTHPALAALPWMKAMDAIEDPSCSLEAAVAHLQSLSQSVLAVLHLHLPSLPNPSLAAEGMWTLLADTVKDIVLDLIRVLVLINLGVSAALGWLLDLACRGPSAWDALNDLDFRDWLRRHGALDLSLGSAPIRALYDLTFGYRGGDGRDINNGSLAAGVTLRFVWSLVFGRKGAPLWKMRSGMGDTLFVPFYQVLTDASEGPARARVAFFHRVTHIALNEALQVDRIRLVRQAVVSGSYQPFVQVNGLDCWPDQPLWDQLQDGQALKAKGVQLEHCDDRTCAEVIELKLGRDFDLVLLAMPPASLATVGADLLKLPAWQQMMDHSASTATGSFQLWLNKDLKALGWQSPTRTASAYAECFASFADMSQTLPYEGWPAALAPVSVQYFCGCLPELPGQRIPLASWVNDWLAQHITYLWPDADLSECVVARYDRLNDQCWHRYVQTPAGSVKHRLSPGASGVSNLFLAGDWTRTTFSGGCFESAIESGMLASVAICQHARTATQD